MQVPQAVEIAKRYVQTLFDDEGVFNIGLEEIRKADDNSWEVTIGFSRAWDKIPPSPLAGFAEGKATVRSYKVIDIDDTGTVKGLRNRDIQ